MAYQQGCNVDGELLSSAYVHKDNSDPSFSLDCSVEPSLTRQEFAAECDINTLMAQYEKTGVINHFNSGTPQYFDFEDMPDLQQSLEIMRDATAAFMQLPAIVRKEFDNDPAEFVKFATDEKNADKLREWGLMAPPPEPEKVQKVEIMNPPSADKPADQSVTK